MEAPNRHRACRCGIAERARSGLCQGEIEINNLHISWRKDPRFNGKFAKVGAGCWKHNHNFTSANNKNTEGLWNAQQDRTCDRLGFDALQILINRPFVIMDRHTIMPDCHNYSLPMSSPGITAVHPVLLFPVVAFQKACTKTQIKKSALCDVTKGRDNSATWLRRALKSIFFPPSDDCEKSIGHRSCFCNKRAKDASFWWSTESFFFFFLTFLSCWKRQNYNQYNLELGTWNSIFQVKKICYLIWEKYIYYKRIA